MLNPDKRMQSFCQCIKEVFPQNWSNFFKNTEIPFRDAYRLYLDFESLFQIPKKVNDPLGVMYKPHLL